jgi:hypothetical protein
MQVEQPVFHCNSLHRVQLVFAPLQHDPVAQVIPIGVLRREGSSFPIRIVFLGQFLGLEMADQLVTFDQLPLAGLARFRAFALIQ